MDRFSEYRIMWVLVFFDLPTDTKKEYRDMFSGQVMVIDDLMNLT